LETIEFGPVRVVPIIRVRPDPSFAKPCHIGRPKPLETSARALLKARDPPAE
jgi:hypothetical protein